MGETQQHYSERIMKMIEGKDPLKTQSATAKTLDRLVKGASASNLRKRPAPDKWSVGEILAPLADTEIVVGWRIRSILTAPGTPIQAFNQDAWAAAGNYAKRDPPKSIEQFRAVREANLALFKSFTPEQPKRYGLHAERGEESLERILDMMAGHDLNHISEIERILAPGK
jgi:DinB superfamily